MLNKPTYFPLPPSSARLHQQELQLQQYTMAAMSARERERERGRLSPEPHLEIMRPVSPFQNKRQLAHQQVQTQATPQTQPQRDQRTFNSHYQTHSTSQPYTHAKQSRAQEASFSSMTTSSHSHSNSSTLQSSSRARPGAYDGDSRGMRGTQRDTDISPALKMMSYETGLTPPSSDQGHGRSATNAPYPAGTLTPSERGELNRSTSPEGYKRKNPGWRKPVPKYIPTPPSTPPTTVYERLSSTRGREEPVPPVPPPSSLASSAPPNPAHPVPAKAHSELVPSAVSHAPPPRPVRAATDHRVPVMFRDLTANLDPPRARIPTVQQATHAHTLHRVANTLSGSLKAVSTPAPNLPQAPSQLRAQSSVVGQVQAPAVNSAPPQAHTTPHIYSPPSLAAAHSHSSHSRPSEIRAEMQRGVLVHPQPKKVPSMAQLVAMVLPSRTPSPRAPPTTAEISGPLPLNPGAAVQSQSATLAPQSTTPSLSVEPPSPAVGSEVSSTAAVSRALLQPCQVQLPPSGDSSAKSSRSVSPQPSPPRATAPLPVRSRSPTPAIIPQYAPPPPPFPPPPPNTPIAAPKPRVSALLRSQVSSRLAEQAIATALEERPEERPAPAPTHERTPPIQDSGPATSQVTQVVSVPVEGRPVSAPIREHSPPPKESGQVVAQATQTVSTSAKERSTAAPMRNHIPPSRESSQTTAQVTQVLSVVAEKRPSPIPMRDHSQPSRESGLATPPITPPGTMVAKASVKEDCGQTRREECNAPESTIVPVVRPRSPAPFLPALEPVLKVVARREALIQDEQLPQDEERPVREADVVSRPIDFTLSLSGPPPPTSTTPNETPAPPLTKLPVDWKETITRAVRSNVNSSPSPPIPSQVETEESSRMLPPMKSAAPSQPHAKREDATQASAYVITKTWTEQVEHATTASELHIHEVGARRVFDAVEGPEKTLLANEKEHRLQTTRSPRRIPATLEGPSATTSAAKYREAHDCSPSGSTLNLALPEAPVRSRSPIQRRKPPLQFNAATNFTQEKADPGVAISSESEVFQSIPSSVPPGPPARQTAEHTSRSHSSGTKRRGKVSRAWVDNDDRNAVQLEEVAIPDRVHHADVPTFNEPSPAFAESQPSTSCVSPPPRYQSLSSRKRLPLNGSDQSLVQSGDKDLTHTHPSSPSVAVRSLSPASQTQPLPKLSRHLHGQHKRLPAPEVTQQVYRPPTPPIPSHYRKKRSNDMLPQEPPSFMKPAVHVIYPDTSTSHGHSFSGDSVLNMSSSKPLNISNRVQPAAGSNPFSYGEERSRPLSPSLSTSASREQIEYENEGPQGYPQVPPKARHTEMNARGPASGSNRQDFTIQHATRGQVRYPSAPIGQARAHTLTLPPSTNSSRSRAADRMERSPSSNLRARRVHQPHATKAARSQSEKVSRNNNNVQPLARSRSTPIPSSRQRNRRGFWRIFGLWARVFMAKFKTWASPSPSPSQLPEYGGYYGEDY